MTVEYRQSSGVGGEERMPNKVECGAEIKASRAERSTNESGVSSQSKTTPAMMKMQMPMNAVSIDYY